MKIETSSIVHHMEVASPEAIKAQRQADLANIASYRAAKLQAYKDWSDPVKRAIMQERAAADLSTAIEIAATMEVASDKAPLFSERIVITPISKPLPPKKRHWLLRLFGFK